MTRQVSSGILVVPLALSSEFLMMPSGRRFDVPSLRTNPYSFIPSTIRLLNPDAGVVSFLLLNK